ncbi:MAG: S-methyl-5-thioribose-1-phosphate isomerase [Gemmatimonadetes bacterium 21-71-4]|nr:MAG: S-methyl-5-thioribose-1-phosphate isomerase [Gemmatimonadetes bacterium 21-71-4]
MILHPLGWTADRRLTILDQTLLPQEERWLELDTIAGVVEAIAALRVRGAPAIGIAAAMGLATSLRPRVADGRRGLLRSLEESAAALRAARPTAVNLGWAMDRMLRRGAATEGDAEAVLAALEAEAQAIWDDDIEACRRIAEHGQRLLEARGHGDAGVVSVLTHCNTGFLATGGVGTALGIVHVAARRGTAVRVWVDETRPLLQGSRLTAWELAKAGIPYAVLPDGAAASLMAAGMVDLVLVGADRVARNGDTANKVGTYPLAIVARHHRVPFYVVAPWSSFDLTCETGAEIPIEQRGAEEVTRPLGVQAAPEGSSAYNPAFDVTSAKLVSGWVTERGILKPPF